MQQDNYDVAIIGGGLAGLSLAIQLAPSANVILFEKETYPFHKVCGEYISMESHGFLERLGIPLADMSLPQISSLTVTAPDGLALRQSLDLGGFGISRYILDNLLQARARALGVTILDGTRVDDVHFEDEMFRIAAGKQLYTSRICCGSFGKRSNLDLKWRRHFTLSTRGRLENHVGVKYHVRGDFPRDTISLHNFQDGYCGISAIEEGKYCL
jgi:flavin-dependent dehydrogenase